MTRVPREATQLKPYYEDDACTIYHGDALEVIASLATEIGTVVTDPPYSSGTRQATDRKASGIPKRGEKWARAGIIWDTSFSAFGLSTYLNHLLRSLREATSRGAHFYLFIDWRQYPMLVQSIESAGLMQNNLIVWDKGVYALGTNWRSQHELEREMANAGAEMGGVYHPRRNHPIAKGYVTRPIWLDTILLRQAGWLA